MFWGASPAEIDFTVVSRLKDIALTMTLNSKAFVTIPFLLVSIIILFLILSFFRLTITLVHASVAQYMAYSTSRKLALGAENKSQDFIENIVLTNHYQKLHSKFFKDSFKSPNPTECESNPDDMFTICASRYYIESTNTWDPQRVGPKGSNEKYTREDEHPNKNLFYGVGVVFDYSRAIRFKIPFLLEDSENNHKTKHAIINSFLGREISKTECEVFFDKRKNFIGAILSQTPRRTLPQNFDPEKINIAPRDNGC